MRIVLSFLLCLACGVANAQTVPSQSPEALLKFVYEQYVGKGPDDAQSFEWSEQPLVGQLFEPTLAAAVIKAGAADPGIDFDPFIDAQDFEIKSYELKAGERTAERARVTATFVNMDKPTTVIYDMVATKAGWRIHDISWPEPDHENFRRLMKVP